MGCTQGEYDAGTDKVRTWDRVAVGAFVAGGIIAAGGLAYYLVTGRSLRTETARLSIDPSRRAFTIGVGF